MLAGEWFDGLSRGDDTYFMLTSKTTGNALPVVFILSGFSAHASMGRGAGSDWTADRPVVHPPSIPPIVVKAWMIQHCDLAPQDAFQAVFRRFRGAFGDIFVSSPVCSSIFQE
jgi:hypothetical protein